MRVCFVAYGAYPLLNNSASGAIGGAEVRAVTFAQGLRDIGKHSIQFVVGSPADIPMERVDGIQIHFRNLRKRAGFLAKLGQAVGKQLTGRPTPDAFFRRLQTDTLLLFGLRNDTASAVRAARESGKRVVLFLTSDRNLDDAARRGRRDRGVYGERGHLCRYALALAHRVVVQTPWQQERLRDQCGIQGSLIPNPIKIRPSDAPVERDSPPLALWVGRADTFSKRADLCVELARRCPAIRFIMVMNRHNPLVFDQIAGSVPPNAQVLEQVPFAEIEAYYRRATVLVNTSAAEGFPNSFLQAGNFGTPVVSLSVDPANMLTAERCGFFADGDMQQLAAATIRYCRGGPEYQLASRNIRDYVASRHDVSSRCDDLSMVLDELHAARGAA